MRVVLPLILVLGVASPAAAQYSPRFDVSGGYSLLRDDEADETFHGWLASAAGYVNPWLGFVGEVGRNSKSISPEAGIEFSASVTSFLGGVRFAGAASPRVSAFAQVLAGGARLGASIDAAGVDDSEGTTKFALQPGAGVDLFFGPAVGLRIGGDYRRVFLDEDEGDGLNEFRFYVGVVLRGR